jgi:glycosyltransferase involved in cell wall biosynthesis
MKFILFGTGDYYERYKKWFDKKDVVALLDNSPLKQNTLIDGIRVVAPEEGVKLEYDYIVILSFYVKAMRQQLQELGVHEDRVIHFYDLHNLIYKSEIKKPVECYGEIKKKEILLLSQDLTLGGPAIALYHVAKVLVKHGYSVVYASMLDGPLRKKFSEEGIPVIVDSNLLIETMIDSDWVSKYSLILCNTINYNVFLSARNTDIPVIWWLHDSAFFYDGISRARLQNMDLKNLFMYSVGPVPRNTMLSFNGNMQIQDLLYGVADKVHDARMYEKTEDKLCFVTIGYIENRKGQDVLLNAIKKLPVELREKSVFYLVGQNSSIMAQHIKREIENMPEIVMTGAVGREEIDDILNKADAMVIPSREDPMPTVAAEAMMHSVPCIVSDATGTSAYIHDKEEGLIFKSEDEAELLDSLKWCFENKNKLAQMRSKSRKIYDNHFSLEVFEKNLLEIVKRCGF